MVAFHFPPIRVSSGLQRSLAFTRYLPENGWHPIVLSAHPRAYNLVSDDQIQDIPKSVPVVRAFVLDTSRHLSVAGRYFDFMALPDRWVTWWVGGVWSGLKLIRKYRPKIIWTTYPIATAHLIGLTLHKLSGLPWVADFRDSMTEDHYPRNPMVRKVFLWIEKRAVRSCSRAVFTTPGAVRMYRDRYPELSYDKWLVIPNGYNEEIFSELENSLSLKGNTDNNGNKPLTLIHSGIIYPSERDPSYFFSAIAELKKNNQIDKCRLKIVLRATGHDRIYQPMLDQMNITDIVHLEAGVQYRDALAEMISADGLLLLQGQNCNHQIPAKIYEYFRSRKPILALTDIEGDTAATIVQAGMEHIVPLDDKEKIKTTLLEFLGNLESNKSMSPKEEIVLQYSRQAGSKTLSVCLDSLI